MAEQKEKKSFALPKASADMRWMYAYLLKGRFLDGEIVDAFVKEKLFYEDEKYHNAVFVGRDEQGVPRHVHRRGTYSESGFKRNADGSSPEYSFHYIGRGNKLFVFEASIDMLSYLSISRGNCGLLVTGGTCHDDWRKGSLHSKRVTAEKKILIF